MRWEQGRLPEAATDLRRALQLEPKHLEDLRWLDLLCVALDDRDGYRRACAALQDVLSNNSDPQWSSHLAYTGTLAPDALADWTLLLQRTEKWAATSPKDLLATFCLGRVLLRAGRHQEAIQHLRRALEQRPKNDPVHDEELLLALAYHHLGKHDEARRWLAEAITWLERFSSGCSGRRCRSARGTYRVGPASRAGPATPA
jgi:tetratricopeptide (TPR) repeat protein